MKHHLLEINEHIILQICSKQMCVKLSHYDKGHGMIAEALANEILRIVAQVTSGHQTLTLCWFS